MTDPETLVMDLMYGRWCSQILYAGVKLGVFEVIGNQPMASAAIAQQPELDPALLYRLLRALGSLGLLKEEPDQHGFVREYRQTAFEHATTDPAYGSAFDAGMSGHSRLQTRCVLDALSAYDFLPDGELMRCGWKSGLPAVSLAPQIPAFAGHGTRTSVIGNRQELWASKLGVADRCRYVAGDMFVDVPGADAYIMKMILHDWIDEECVQILRILHERVTPGGRVFIAEHVIPDRETPHFSKIFDIHMMVWGTGRERTIEEYANLLHSASWRYLTCWSPTSEAIRVIEGIKD